MTPSGLKHIPKEDREECIVVYFDIDIKERRFRLSKRSDFDKVERRIKADGEDFSSFMDYDIRVTNPKYDVEALHTTILSYAKCNIK